MKTQQSQIRKILTFLDEKFEEIIGVILLAFVVTIIFIGVVMRLGFTSGLPWQEEISRILYVLVIYLGASYGIKDNDHIRVTFIYNMLPKKLRGIVHLLTDLIWIAFNLCIFLFSLDVLQNMLQFKAYTAVLGIGLHYVFGIIPFSFLLITFRIIQTMITRLQSGEYFSTMEEKEHIVTELHITDTDDTRE
jgi:TRAP-type C4-dicarboxylate transport system permease small subunit